MIRGLFQDILYALKKNKLAMLSMGFLFFIFTLSILVPLFSPYNYYSQDLKSTLLQPFSQQHIFGTDEFGRDLFTRVWSGARISITIGVCAALLQVIIGVIYGGMAGSAGGIVDEIMMRIVDVIYSIPYLIIVILLSMFMGNSEFTIVFALAISDWTGTAKVVRAQTLKLKEMDYVKAARVLGLGKFKILFRHIIPNSLGPMMVSFMFSIPAAIFAEAFLSFIGLGVQIPKASLGTLASDGYKYIMLYPWLLMIPLFLISVTIFAFNIVGEAIRDIFD